MESERWKRIDRILDAALELEPDKRTSFLEENCSEDEDLRKEVEELLASYEKAHNFIESPAYLGAEELLSTAPARLSESQLLSAGRYQILTSLGSGGMGEVYRAKDLRLGREVAIKVLPERLAKDSTASKRFEGEATALAALSHPNIVSIFDIAADQETSFVVMELLQGETLRARMLKGPIPWREAVEISISIGEGLSAAHSKGVIHRDLKPENIFLTAEGVVKILDFGLARFDRSLSPDLVITDSLTAPPSNPMLIIGTVGYMSPEQIRAGHLDARSDLFSFGCILYEMLNGKRPFTGKTAGETIASIINDAPPPISPQTAKDFPPSLQEAIYRCIEKKPKDRFASAGDVAFELKKMLGGSAIQTTSPILFPFASYRRIVWVVAISVLLLAIASIAIFQLRTGTLRSTVNFPVTSTSTDPSVPSGDVHRKTIAILPFRPLVATNRDEVLELGMTDTLITRLSNTKAITVRPLSSVRNFNDPNQDSIKAGKALNVESVLEGNLQRSEDRIRVNVRMVRVADGATIWAGTFDEKPADIFVVQDAIASKIADALGFDSTGNERARIEKRYTSSAEAYDYYILGRYHELKITEEGLHQAIGFYERAIKADPRYALAYASMGEANRRLAAAGFARANDVIPRAEMLARKALEIDESLSEAYLVLGWVDFVYKWNWVSAEKMFKRAIELNPNDFQPHLGYAYLLLDMGRPEEAVAEARRARELSPMTLIVLALESQILLAAGHVDEAVLRAKNALDFDPNFWVARFHLGEAYTRQKRYAEAIAEFDKVRSLAPKSFASPAAFIDLYSAMGDKKRLTAILGETEKQSKESYVPFLFIAQVYNALGQTDKALDLLERSLDEHEVHLVGIITDKCWDNLRSDPRFINILRKMNVQVSTSKN